MAGGTDIDNHKNFQNSPAVGGLALEFYRRINAHYGRLAAFVKDRYKSWDSELGRRVESGQSSFAELEGYIMPKGDVTNVSGRQEMLENLINEFI